ncbi:MAG: SMP-30/gluconolactonase/LRE family protein [Candidatus Marinimicrobia bacterium]|nr:SMP-30/gluconolactonase/LRE family protein [Candidatus Neomarinimicrobiota bacterium]
MKQRKLIAILLFSIGLFSFSCEQKSLLPDGNWIKVADSLDFPEGPTWDGQSTLYVSNCYGDWITKIHDGIVDTFLVHSEEIPEFNRTNGLLFHNNFLYACDFGSKAILKISADKTVTILSTGTPERPFKRPNDLAMGPDACLYVTDPFHYDRANPDGAVYKINPGTGATSIVIPNLAFPNGIAFSPDKQSLFVCESAMNRVLKYPFNDGKVGSKRSIFIELSGGDPDGIAFDEKGNLYIAHFGGGAVYMVHPSGETACYLKTPGNKPTNLEFGGKNLKTLYLTEVETNAVYKLETKIKGMTLFK